MTKQFRIISLVLLIFTSPTLFSQYGHSRLTIGGEYTEGYLFFNAGPAYCFGDAYGSPFSNTFLTGDNWSTSIGYRNAFNEYISISAQIEFGRYKNTDLVNKSHGMGFYSSEANLGKGILRAELSYPIKGRYRYYDTGSLYMFLGLGGMYGNIYYQEGCLSGVPIVSTALFPVGFGFRKSINKKLSWGLEVCTQMGLSDYLDGYFPSKSSVNHNDILFSSSFQLSYKIF